MPDLPQKKIGIVACSGEELPEGTVTRLAALRVLEELRSGQTVTICLPLFLAGGEGDRAFARFYPTIALDGCTRRCAALGTETYSGKPAAELVVTQLVATEGLETPHGLRRLDAAGERAVDATANRLATLVDELSAQPWSRRAGVHLEAPPQTATPVTCSCGSSLPIQELEVDGRPVQVVGLPLILEQLRSAGVLPGTESGRRILQEVKVYNAVPAGAEQAYATALERAYLSHCATREEGR
jgi:uncharacterized metal-binding protein